MQPSTDFVTRASERLLRQRWLIMALIGLINIAVETAERRLSTLATVDVYFVQEILLFGFVGPLLGGLALSWVARAKRKQRTADHHLSLHRELGALLGEVENWDELTALVVRFPRRVVDLRGAGLLLADETQGKYCLEAHWWDPNEASPVSLTSLGSQDICHDCAKVRGPLPEGVFPVRCVKADEPDLGDRYCMPLLHGGKLIGLLHLFVGPGVSLTGDEARALSAMAGPMATAIYESRPQRMAMIQAKAADAERQRIARDLHDSLGQSLAYLNLKLGQLSCDESVREVCVIRQELDQLRTAAGDAYLQVRATLSELQPLPPSDLVAALQQEAQAAAERAGFELSVLREGLPRPLAPHTQHHLQYLLGEALTNIERHAGARHVELYLTWTEERLDIRLSDDGRGFDTGVAPDGGHYGLLNMQQRALEVDAELEVTSSPGSGTDIRLSLPLALRSQPQGEPI